MKMGRFHTLCIITIIFFQIPNSTRSEPGDLVFTIDELENHITQYSTTSRDKSKTGSTFYFDFTLLIENPTNVTITAEHPNSGMFRIQMGYSEHLNWEDRSPSGGFSIIVKQELEPGLTEMKEEGGIFFNGTDILPDGHYNITISAYPNIRSVHDFYIVSNEVTQTTTDTQTVTQILTKQVDGLNESLTTNSNITVNTVVPLFPIILAVIIVGISRKINSRSSFCK